MRRLQSLCILITLNACYSLAAQLLANGQAYIPGYNQTTYRSWRSRPLCGTLDPSTMRTPLYAGSECEASIRDFREVQVTFAVYSKTGRRLSDTTPIGQGLDVCMCFALAQEEGNEGLQANICLAVRADGEQEITFMCPGAGCPTASGRYELGGKALPWCHEIDEDSVTQSLAALGTQTSAQIVAPPRTIPPVASSTEGPSGTSTTTAPPQSSAVTSTVPTHTPSPQPPTPSRCGPYKLAIWLPLLLLFLTGFAIAWKRGVLGGWWPGRTWWPFSSKQASTRTLSPDQASQDVEAQQRGRR